MKNSLAITTLSSLLAGTSALAAELTVFVHGIEPADGGLNIAIFDSVETYDSRQDPVLAARARVAGGTWELTLKDLADGMYAIRMFHDENDNGELDTNLIGLPKEGYGFSNDAGARGPASYDDAAFKVSGETRMEIRIR